MGSKYAIVLLCSIEDIRQRFEYALISEYTRVENILWLWIFQGYTRFWTKYSMVDVWQYYEFALNSEYVRVLSMLGFHKVLSKILHNRYRVSEGPEYVSSSECHCYTGLRRKSPIIFLGFSVYLGVNILGLWICQGYTGLSINCVLKIHGILNVLSSEYAKVLNVS